MVGFRDIVALADARHLFGRRSHADVGSNDEVCRGFESREGAMGAVMRRDIAGSHERCCYLKSHIGNFMGASYLFEGVSNSSRGIHAPSEVRIVRCCEQQVS